jgi:hypothetical protein
MGVLALARMAFFLLSPLVLRLFTIYENVFIACLIATITLCTRSTNYLFIDFFSVILDYEAFCELLGQRLVLAMGFDICDDLACL